MDILDEKTSLDGEKKARTSIAVNYNPTDGVKKITRKSTEAKYNFLDSEKIAPRSAKPYQGQRKNLLIPKGMARLTNEAELKREKRAVELFEYIEACAIVEKEAALKSLKELVSKKRGIWRLTQAVSSGKHYFSRQIEQKSRSQLKDIGVPSCNRDVTCW